MSDLYTADLDWLYARQRFGVRPGLEVTRALLARLGHPETQFNSVLVGGTNGKGSVAAVLAAMLGAAGQGAALFTSPHLTRFTERFVVDGQELPAQVVAAGLARVRPLAEELGASFFEVVTGLAGLLFAEAGVAWAVLEVGLGGRLDATNALEPELSVVTSIGLDHTAILGDTIAAIAREKAGILRLGRPAVTGATGEALSVLDQAGADLWALDREVQLQAKSLGWNGWRVNLDGPAGRLAFSTPLLGAHGARNAALAALTAQRLGLPGAAIQSGAGGTRWPGRLELLPWNGRRVLLDGAHNPDGARALVAAMRGLGAQRVPLLFGAASDKDVAGLASELGQLASQLILTRAQLSPRAAEPADLAAAFRAGGFDGPIQLAGTPRAALALLPPGLSVACGSLYLIGELRPLLLGEADEGRERWQ